MDNQISHLVTTFQGKLLPEVGFLAGYAALIHEYDLPVPIPDQLCVIGERHRIFEKDGWKYFSPRHAPSQNLEGNLTFALKYEGIDLNVLNRLFMNIQAEEITDIVNKTPTGIYVRRIWFLYEWLMDKKLDVQDLRVGSYVPVVDPKMQYALKGVRSTRQRVVNNLPGTKLFCPLIRRTPLLESFIALNLPARARDVLAKIPKDVMNRTAAFLLLKDSRASYAIEGETPAHTRLERWGRVISEAGTVSLSKEELLRLQRIVIGNSRFIQIGLRTEGGFVGEHDRETGMPIPEHISARPDDLESLVEGIVAYNTLTKGQVDPVISAAALAFGFVYIHPFVDGNGRLHRYVIHQVLSENGYNPPQIIFPVSVAMLENIDEYREVLLSYSKKILPLIEWKPTDDNNVEVSNRTDDYYRFFDATRHAEYLFSCVQKTIEEYLPEESHFLQQYDAFRAKVENIVEMPSRTVNLLYRFLSQNNGQVSERARKKEFAELTDTEVEKIEKIYIEQFT